MPKLLWDMGIFRSKWQCRNIKMRGAQGNWATKHSNKILSIWCIINNILPFYMRLEYFSIVRSSTTTIWTSHTIAHWITEDSPLAQLLILFKRLRTSSQNNNCSWLKNARIAWARAKSNCVCWRWSIQNLHEYESSGEIYSLIRLSRSEISELGK